MSAEFGQGHEELVRRQLALLVEPHQGQHLDVDRIDRLRRRPVAGLLVAAAVTQPPQARRNVWLSVPLLWGRAAACA